MRPRADKIPSSASACALVESAARKFERLMVVVSRWSGRSTTCSCARTPPCSSATRAARRCPSPPPSAVSSPTVPATASCAKAASARPPGSRSRSTGTSSPTPTCAASTPANTRACSTPGIAARSRPASNARISGPATPTCLSPPPRWRWASTSVTCRRSCSPRCPTRSPSTSSASAAEAASRGPRCPSPTSRGEVRTCPGSANPPR